MLNEKQEKFAEAYVLHRNATEAAKAAGHTNSAIKALEVLSRVRGTNSDKGLAVDKDTLETAIIGCLNVLGEDKVVQLLSKCNFAVELFEEDYSEDEEESSGDENETILVEENE